MNCVANRVALFVVFTGLVILNSGCAIVDRFDTMISDLQGMRNQLTAIHQTNEKLDQMNRQLYSVEQQLSALQETNSGIRAMSKELGQVNQGITSVDSNMIKLLDGMTGE